MDLTELIPLREWEELEMDIHNRFGLNVNIFNTDGIRITSVKNWANRLCPAIKATDRGQSFICAVAHMNLSTMAQHRKESVVEVCDAGILKIVIPIFIRESFIGAVGACGHLPDNGEVESFLVNKITGLDEEEVKRLSRGIPRISSEGVQALKAYVEERIEDIVRGYVSSASH